MMKSVFTSLSNILIAVIKVAESQLQVMLIKTIFKKKIYVCELESIPNSKNLARLPHMSLCLFSPVAPCAPPLAPTAPIQICFWLFKSGSPIDWDLLCFLN